MDTFKEQVRKGFQRCKTDIEALNTTNMKNQDDVEKLNAENFKLHEEVSDLKSELKNIYSIMSEMKELLISKQKENNTHKSEDYKRPTRKISPVYDEEDFEEVEHREPTRKISPVYDDEEEEIEYVKPKPKKVKPVVQPSEIKDPYEALLAFKAKSNKKDLLKQKVVSMVTENGITLSELKFLFVDHYRYSSKATFYNYLKEIELEKKIRIERTSSKNVVYLVSEMIIESRYD